MIASFLRLLRFLKCLLSFYATRHIWGLKMVRKGAVLRLCLIWDAIRFCYY